MDAEVMFYIINTILLGGWLLYKAHKHSHEYMSAEWMEGAGL